MASFFSPALHQELLNRRDVQTTLLLKAVAGLSDKINLQRADGSWESYSRWLDPDDQATPFNDNNVEVRLSQLVPGLLGVFSRRVAYPPNATPPSSGISTLPSPNMGIYAGVLMLDSEWKEYDAAHSHSMGVELKGVRGRSLTRTKAVAEGVTLVGLPTCAVVQALHSEKPNGALTSRHAAAESKELLSKKVGCHDVALPFNVLTLQAQKRLAAGEELTILYSRRWQHTAVSCAVCCLTVTDEEVHSKPSLAFKCKGFIDGSPCPFIVHRKCAAQRGVSPDWEYCQFCFVLSANDDRDCDSTPWLDHLPSPPQSDAEDLSVQACTLTTTASFAAALHRAISLGWIIVEATVIERTQKPDVAHSASSRRVNSESGAQSRVVEYRCQQSAVRFPEEGVRFRMMHSRLKPSSPPFERHHGDSTARELVADSVPLSSLLSSFSSNPSSASPSSAVSTATELTYSPTLSSSPVALSPSGYKQDAQTSAVELITEDADDRSELDAMDDSEAPSLLSQDVSLLSSLDSLTSNLGEHGDVSEDSRDWVWPEEEVVPKKDFSCHKDTNFASPAPTFGVPHNGSLIVVEEVGAARVLASAVLEPIPEASLSGDLVDSEGINKTPNATMNLTAGATAQSSSYLHQGASPSSLSTGRAELRTSWKAQPAPQQIPVATRAFSAIVTASSGPFSAAAKRRPKVMPTRRCLSSSLAMMNLTERTPSDLIQIQPTSRPETPPTPVMGMEATSTSEEMDARTPDAQSSVEVPIGSVVGLGTIGDKEVADINDGWYPLSGSEADDEDALPAQASLDEKMAESDSSDSATSEHSDDSDYHPGGDRHSAAGSVSEDSGDEDSNRTDSDDPRSGIADSILAPTRCVEAAAASDGAGAATNGDLAIPASVGPSSDAAQDAVYDNLQPRAHEQGFLLSGPDKRLCRQMVNDHRRRDGLLAQKELNDPRFLRQLSKGSKRAEKKKEKLQRRVLGDDGHCPREQCNLKKFEMRLQQFATCCATKQRRRIQNALLSENDRTLWENRAQRLNRLEENPVEILKAQLSSAQQAIGSVRQAFFAQYGGNVPRATSQETSVSSDVEDAAYSEADVVRSDDDIEPLSDLPDLHISASVCVQPPLLSTSAVNSARGPRQLKPMECAVLLELNYAGVPVCLKCYVALYPEVSPTSLTEWSLRLGKGRGYDATGTQPVTGEHSARHRTGPAPASKTALTTQAIHSIARLRGDAAPNRNLIVLPERTIEQLTESVNLWIATECSGLQVSESLVKKVMHALEGQVKLAGREHALPVCDLCSTFSKILKPSDAERNMQKIHLAIQQSERTAVDINCRKAIDCPEENLTIYMDGMDQAKTALPSLLDQPHWLQSAMQWKTHITGVMAFGPLRTFAYLNYENIHSSAALSVHILSDVLRRVLHDIDEDIKEVATATNAPTDSEPLSSALASDASASSQRRCSPHSKRYTRRPKRLFLVMDNSGKDNKNNCVFRFLSLLVQRGIFEEIWINFLIVGHTHDRVDQFFSCISRQLATKDTWTPVQLQEQIKLAFRLGGESNAERRLPLDAGIAADGNRAQIDDRFDGDITLDALCRKRPEVILLDSIADWGTWLGIGGKEDETTQRSSRPGVSTSTTLSTVSPSVDDADDAPNAPPRSELIPDTTLTAGAARRADGLPCFTGTISNISLPQVFFISKNLQQEVELRVKPHSFKLQLARGSDAKLKVELHEIALQDPIVLISADAPVPCIDPHLFPPYPFPFEALRGTFNTMVLNARTAFPPILQSQWTTELERMQRSTAQQSAACTECTRQMQAMASIKLASDYKKQTMTDSQREEEKMKSRSRSRLKQELLQHMKRSDAHARALGLWSRMWAPCDSQLIDPVQLRIPGRISVERADRDNELRRQHREEATTGYVQNLHKFIQASTLNTADYNRFELGLHDHTNRPLVSIATSRAAQRAAVLAAEVPSFQRIDGQDRSVPIAVGDLVAIHVDNYQWPEYPVSIALVIEVVQPKKRKRQRGRQKEDGRAPASARRKKKKGAANAATSDSEAAHGPRLALDGDDGEAKNDGAVGAAQLDWGDTNGKTQLKVQFYYLRFPSYKAAQHLLDAKVERYKTKGVPDMALACLRRALHSFKMTYHFESQPSSRTLNAFTPSRAVRNVEHDNEPQELGEAASDGKEEKGSTDGSNSDNPMSDVESIDSGGDGDYMPEGKQAQRDIIKQIRHARVEEERRLKRQRERIVSRQLEVQGSLHLRAAALSSSSSSSPSSLRSPSMSGPLDIPSVATLSSDASSIRGRTDQMETIPQGVATFPIHAPLSSHYEWTSSAPYLPATWWRVFTEMNDIFEAAKPSADVLRQLPPFLSVADLEAQSLGMVLLPPAQRVTQVVLQEEVLCWEQCNQALTRDGYFTPEFAVKVHHCLELNRQTHGGYYGNDDVTDDERDDDDGETEQSGAPVSRQSAAASHVIPSRVGHDGAVVQAMVVEAAAPSGTRIAQPALMAGPFSLSEADRET
jgi:hypothetical protein